MMQRTQRKRGISLAVLTILVVLIIGAASVAILSGLLQGQHSSAPASSSTNASSTMSTGSATATTTASTGATSSSSQATDVSSSSRSSTSFTTSSSSTSSFSSTSSSSTTSGSTTSTTSSSTTSSSTTTSTGSTSSSGPSSISVGSQFANGTVVSGVFTELALNNQEVSTGYTPITFQTTSGHNYTVTVSDSKNLYFNRWSNDFASRVIPVTATASTVSLTAVFTTTPQVPPPTPYSITVDSSTLNGTAIRGYFIDVRIGGYHIASGFTPVTFQNLEPGLQYQVVAYWAGNYYFRNFAGGDLNRYELMTFNSTGTKSASFDAIYEYVPPSQSATLNVIAEFPNGTQIGTTFNNTGYIQHTPGMWLTVTPPGATVPYTGSYTGGSLLPFVLFRNEPYTLQMTLTYGDLKFAYWQDTQSTNGTRTITLAQGPTTVIAIYEEAQAPTSTHRGLGSQMTPTTLAILDLCLAPWSLSSRRSEAIPKSPGGRAVRHWLSEVLTSPKTTDLDDDWNHIP